MTRVLTIVAVACLTASMASVRAQELSRPGADWRIAQLRGGVYRVDADGQVTVFMATGEGIVLLDPLNTTVAAWLKDQLAIQFPGEPVRYIAYTSHRFNRASGGFTFGKSATVIAHEAFDSERKRATAKVSGAASAFDVNRDGRLQRDELNATAQSVVLAAYDFNDDEIVTATELYSSVRSPDLSFSRRRAMTVADHEVDLIHVQAPSAADASVAYFPGERVLFTADLLPIGSLPGSLGPNPRGTIESLRTIESLDFDVLLTESGAVGTKADVTAFREYLETLTNQVRAGFNAGRSLLEVQQDVNLVRYSALGNYARLRETNVAEAYHLLRPVLTRVFGAPYINLQHQTAGSCERSDYDTCTTTARWPSVGGVVGMNVAIGRVMAGGEIGSVQIQTARQRQSDNFFPPVEYVFQHRAAVASFLLGYEFGDATHTSITLVGGPSFVFANNAVTAFSTGGPPYFVAEKTTGLGLVIGANIMRPITSTMSIMVPVRLTQANRGTSDVWGGHSIGSVSISGGVGLQFSVARRSR